MGLGYDSRQAKPMQFHDQNASVMKKIVPKSDWLPYISKCKIYVTLKVNMIPFLASNIV